MAEEKKPAKPLSKFQKMLIFEGAKAGLQFGQSMLDRWAEEQGIKVKKTGHMVDETFEEGKEETPNAGNGREGTGKTEKGTDETANY